MRTQKQSVLLVMVALGCALTGGSACTVESSYGGQTVMDAGRDGPASSPDAGDAARDAGPLGCTSQPPQFSFFVTSMDALWDLSGSTPGDMAGGFGGNLGGLAGADNICQTIGARTGHGAKVWRAFLSATDDGNGSPVHAIERIGTGPWHDAFGRLVASDIGGLLAGDRPAGDPQTVSDLPDECGGPLSLLGDAHDVVTGSGPDGRLASANLASTCNDWTSGDGNVGSGANGALGPVRCGHSFPRLGITGHHWLSDHGLRGCGKGASLIQAGAGDGTCIGCTGGYGAIYCFAL